MFKKLAIAAAASAMLLAGCATSGGADKLGATIYLRGEMNSWQALPEYEVKPIGGDVYATEAFLKADGNPYKFKFADSGWTCGTNFGHKGTADVVLNGEPAPLNPCPKYDDLKFTPVEDATYVFYLDMSSEPPTVKITKK